MSNLESDEKQIIKRYAFSIKTDCTMLVEGSGTDMSCFDRVFFFLPSRKIGYIVRSIVLESCDFPYVEQEIGELKHKS